MDQRHYLQWFSGRRLTGKYIRRGKSWLVKQPGSCKPRVWFRVDTKHRALAHLAVLEHRGVRPRPVAACSHKPVTSSTGTGASYPTSLSPRKSGDWFPEPTVASRLPMVEERPSLALLPPQSNCRSSCHRRELAPWGLGCVCAPEVGTCARCKVTFPLDGP